ncbi:MAG: LemA family protein [Cyclobacteriaceae bacterium]|jgi:LemA protein|nr:LemA family protein [Cyclobacteriaceae bacterium]
MNKSLIIGVVAVLAAVVIFYLWGAGVYNKAVGLQEGANESWANVQAAYQRRADLVPNLVATVREAAENERGILTQVTEARAGISKATTPEELESAGKQINSAINLAFEAYPQIRSTENFQDLQVQLEGTENRINVARQEYNGTIKSYNTHIRGYFTSMALNWFGKGETFEPLKGFTASEGAENAPKVDELFNK